MNKHNLYCCFMIVVFREAQETIKTQEKNWDKEKTDLNTTIKEQHEHLSKLIESR